MSVNVFSNRYRKCWRSLSCRNKWLLVTLFEWSTSWSWRRWYIAKLFLPFLLANWIICIHWTMQWIFFTELIWSNKNTHDFCIYCGYFLGFYQRSFLSVLLQHQEWNITTINITTVLPLARRAYIKGKRVLFAWMAKVIVGHMSTFIIMRYEFILFPSVRELLFSWPGSTLSVG